MNVQDQTCCAPADARSEIFFRRGERGGPLSQRFDQGPQTPTCALVIVDDCDHLVLQALRIGARLAGLRRFNPRRPGSHAVDGDMPDASIAVTFALASAFADEVREALPDFSTEVLKHGVLSKNADQEGDVVITKIR